MFHYYMNASASWWREVCVPRVLAALGHDVGRAELAGQLLPRLVAAHRDDPLRTHLLGQQLQQADRPPSLTIATVMPGSTLAASAANQPGAKHIRDRHQARNKVVRRHA
jgi:hypothetical protein